MGFGISHGYGQGVMLERRGLEGEGDEEFTAFLSPPTTPRAAQHTHPPFPPIIRGS